MKGKLLQKLIAVVLVFCLTATNFIFVATSAVYALSDAEGVEFKAYFKNQDKTVSEKTANISEGDKLYISIQLPSVTGKVLNPKIKLNDSNFTIDEAKVNNKLISNINLKSKEITLRDLNYGDSKDGIIEVELPVKFEEAEKIPTSYFDMGEKSTEISLSGQYVNSSEKNIKDKSSNVKLTWTETYADEERPLAYESNIDKIIYLEDNKTIVEVGVSSKYVNKYLPKQEEKITINVPKVDQTTPSYSVLVDGKKIDLSDLEVSTDGQKITIINNFVDNEGNILWNKAGNEYKIIYVYDGISKLENMISFEGKLETSLLGMKQNGSFTRKSNVPKGTISSVTAESTSTDIYKGYMYADSDETEYSEKYNMEISYVNGVKSTLELEEDNFKTQNGKTLSTNNKTEYKEIKINKDKLVKVLGKKGSLKIIPENKKLNEIVINSSNAADENGDIVVEYNRIKDSHNVKFEVSAENEGMIDISVRKAIKGNAGYDKAAIKTINAIETTVKSYTEKDENPSTAVATTELKETVTEATLTMNNNNILSTTADNNVEFTATLKTGTMDTDLLKNPTLKIVLPEEVTKITLNSVSALYLKDADGKLDISSQEVDEENKAILVKLDGEQFKRNNKFIEGIKIIVDAKIELNSDVVSRDTKIDMIYTNENSSEKEYTTSTEVSIQAPYGLNTTSTTDTHFDEINNGTELFNISMKNNYGKTLNSIAIVSEMPDVENSKEEFEKVITDKYNAEYTSKDGKSTKYNGQSVKVEYSKDLKTWNNEYKDAKYFKVSDKDGEIKLNNGDSLKIAFEFNTSNIVSNFKATYMLESQEVIQEIKLDKQASSIEDEEKDKQEEPEKRETIEEPEKQEQKDPLTVSVSAKEGNGETIKDGDEVYAGQTIRFTYILTNTTEKDINNVKFAVKNENTNIFEDVPEEQPDSLNPGKNTTFTTEKENDQKDSQEVTIDTIKPGKSKRIAYQVRVKQGVEEIKNTLTITADGIDKIEKVTTNKVKPAELNLKFVSNVAKEYPKSKGNIVQSEMLIENTSNEKLKNITVTVSIPKSFKYEDLYEVGKTENYKILQKDDNKLIFVIDELAAGATKHMILSVNVVAENLEKDIKETFNYSAKVNKNLYYSNDITVGVTEKITTQLSARQTTNIEEDTVSTGDDLTYTIKVKNTSNYEDLVMIKDVVPEAAVIKKAYITIGDENKNITNIKNNTITEQVNIKSGETIALNIETQIDESKTGEEKITNFATITGTYFDKEIKTNSISYKLKTNAEEKEKQRQEAEKEEEKNNNNGKESSEGNNQTENNDNNNKKSVEVKTETKESISGIAWIDENKNGIRENKEKAFSGIKVSLANVETGKYVTDAQGNRLQVTTNENGEYIFEDITDGKYIVIFTFDNVKYRNTEYRTKNATDTTNSDIITSKLSKSNEDINYGITDTLELNGRSLKNVDAGFIENEIFDLTLHKYITKATVQNAGGTVVKQYNKQQLAKLEIDAKNLVGSTVLVEYTIEITNDGEVPGYVNEIIDYIPKDLSFSSELNKDWYISTDGNIHSIALSKKQIQPGQSVSIPIILVKTMTENNTGLTLNKAEIIKASNELSIPDKDLKTSSIGGKTSNANSGTSVGSSQTNEAELLVSVRTGVEYTIGTIVAIIALTAAGIIIYTKKRKEASHE